MDNNFLKILCVPITAQPLVVWCIPSPEFHKHTCSRDTQLTSLTALQGLMQDIWF